MFVLGCQQYGEVGGAHDKTLPGEDLVGVAQEGLGVPLASLFVEEVVDFADGLDQALFGQLTAVRRQGETWSAVLGALEGRRHGQAVLVAPGPAAGVTPLLDALGDD